MLMMCMRQRKRHGSAREYNDEHLVGRCLLIKTYIARKTQPYMCTKRPNTIVLLQKHLESLPTHESNLLTMLTSRKSYSPVMADDVNDLSRSLSLSLFRPGPRVMNLASHEVDIQSRPPKRLARPHTYDH